VTEAPDPSRLAPRPSGSSSARPDALVALDNPHPGRRYRVRCETPEFTCVCPVTGQPDFATVTIDYEPGRSIVELKSLKLYLWSYRDVGAFHEDVTNRLLGDLVALLEPRTMTITTDWLVRGGIHTVVDVAFPDVGVPGRPEQSSR